MRAVFSTDISSYPYDTQVAEVNIASTDYSTEKVRITTRRWESLSQRISGHWINGHENLTHVKHDQYLSNSEWNFFAYKFEIVDAQSIINKKYFSQLTIKFALTRAEPYYTLTMFVPIMVMTQLAPIGLILPGNIVLKSDSFG